MEPLLRAAYRRKHGISGPAYGGKEGYVGRLPGYAGELDVYFACGIGRIWRILMRELSG